LLLSLDLGATAKIVQDDGAWQSETNLFLPIFKQKLLPTTPVGASESYNRTDRMIVTRITQSVRRRAPVPNALVSLAALLAMSSTVVAHPVPVARATLDLHSTGTCELRIACDASALVMQTMPGHLGAAAGELQSMSDRELAARVTDAQGALGYYLHLSFGGVRHTTLRIQMPPLEVIRSGAAHGGEDAWPKIVLQGNWPAHAKTCEISFPKALGRVQFQLFHHGEKLFSRELAAGSASGLIRLQANRIPSESVALQGNWVGWTLVGLLLAYLLRLCIRHP
jgi:hypothetical protein